MLEESQVLAFLTALALLLVIGRIAGEIARRVGQPEVLGTLAAGVLLGPSVLGAALPDVQHWLFEQDGTAEVLAGISQLGAVLLLLVAGLEVDLRVLKRELRPGLWVAGTAIVPSLVAGALIGERLGAQDMRGAIYLGIVLSVTAISVVTTLLLESGDTRRRWAQVVLAGGVAAEVTVWVLVASVSGQGESALASSLRSLGLAAAVFAVAFLVGQRLVPAVMRFTADTARLPESPLTAVLALTLLAGAGTAALHLHPLLGAFLVGVLLARAPRTNAALLSRVEALTVALFAPAFFVLAGTQVDLAALGAAEAVVQVIALFVVATLVKIVPVAIGARLGGLRGAEPFVVGTAMNLKGGTDILVATVGVQLGILSTALYTQYAVVALLTVLVMPPVLRLLRRRIDIGVEEKERLEREEADRQSYLPSVERVLVPFVPELRPSLAADVVDRLARTADDRDRLIDVTSLRLDAEHEEDSVGHGVATLAGTSEVRSVRLREMRTKPPDDVVEEVTTAARSHDLLAIGAPLDGALPGTLAPMQNAVIDQSPIDVVVVAGNDHQLPWDRIRRILVPTNGTAHARAAAELAGRLAETSGAEITLMTVVDPELREAVRRRRESQNQLPGTAHLDAVRFLLKTVKARVREMVLVGEPEDEMRALLRRREYDLVVMGAVDEPGDGIAWFGPTVEAVVAQHETPYVLVVTHRTE